MQKLKPATLDRSAPTIKARIKELTTGFGMTRKQAKETIKSAEPESLFINDKYVVSVFKNEPHGFGSDVTVWHLSIRRQDREACEDWRDFQQIKNEICGNEREGLELYPAESRVMDAANQYHIFVIMNDGFLIPVGYTDYTDGNGKRDDGAKLGKAKQRPFEKDSAK